MQKATWKRLIAMVTRHSMMLLFLVCFCTFVFFFCHSWSYQYGSGKLEACRLLRRYLGDGAAHVEIVKQAANHAQLQNQMEICKWLQV